MNKRSIFQLYWLSSLGASVILFLLYGAALKLGSGIQWTLIVHTSVRKPILLTSECTGTIAFGQPPAVFYRNDPRRSDLFIEELSYGKNIS